MNKLSQWKNVHTIEPYFYLNRDLCIVSNVNVNQFNKYLLRLPVRQG